MISKCLVVVLIKSFRSYRVSPYLDRHLWTCIPMEDIHTYVYHIYTYYKLLDIQVLLVGNSGALEKSGLLVAG